MPSGRPSEAIPRTSLVQVNHQLRIEVFSMLKKSVTEIVIFEEHFDFNLVCEALSRFCDNTIAQVKTYPALKLLRIELRHTGLTVMTPTLRSFNF